MSLLLPETLIAYIGPGEVVAVRKRGWRGLIVGQHILQCASADSGGVSEMRAYVAIIDELRKLVAETGVRSLQIVLSNHWVRYLVHAWRADAETDEEQHLLARMSFTEIYGSIADDWTIAFSDDAPGRPRLAAAIDGKLFSMLSDVASESGVALKSVQPLLIGVANAAERQYRRSEKWIVVHEAGRLTLALFDGKTWVWTRSQRVMTDWTANFSGLLAQEALLAGRGEGAEAIVFAPLIKRTEIIVRPGQPVRLLALSAVAQAASDPRFAYPLVFP